MLEQRECLTIDELMPPQEPTLSAFCERFLAAFDTDCNNELRLTIQRSGRNIFIRSGCADRCRERELQAGSPDMAEALTLLVEYAEVEQKRQQLRALVENLDSEGIERAIKAAQC